MPIDASGRLTIAAPRPKTMAFRILSDRINTPAAV